MRKTFIQKLAEFKRLGSHVIYTDFSRILLATLKPPCTAHAYATSITTAVTSHELFKHMYLKTQQFYDFLLFMDSANMGGVVCEDPLAVDPPRRTHHRDSVEYPDFPTARNPRRFGCHHPVLHRRALVDFWCKNNTK
jgi:hypothetical protein